MFVSVENMQKHIMKVKELGLDDLGFNPQQGQEILSTTKC
jgi:hypothetical protein